MRKWLIDWIGKEENEKMVAGWIPLINKNVKLQF